MNQLVLSFSAITFLGIILFGVDKILIQGIDYTKGLTDAKYQAIDNRMGESGVSSIASVLGYLFSAFGFICYIISLIFYEKLPKFTRSIALLTALLSVAAVSFFTGGRSSILILFGLSFGVVILRKVFGCKYFPFSKAQMLLVGLFLSGTFFYLIYVFQSRAELSDIVARVYTEEMIDHVNGHYSDGLDRLMFLPDDVSTYVYFSTLLGVYGVHSSWTFEGVLEMQERTGSATFLAWRDLLIKVGIGSDYEPWQMGGVFITLPGGFYHDFGLNGLLIFSLFHGMLLGLSLFLLENKVFNFLTIGLFFLLSCITFCSPFILATDVMMFPMLTVSFALAYIYMVFANKKLFIQI